MLDSITAIFEALGGRIELVPSWHGAGIDRVLDEGHARLAGQVLAILKRYGWDTQLEVTFASFGERGSIDILAWHAVTRTLLVIEIKTELGSVEGLLRPLDVKCRLATEVALKRFGWRSGAISRLVVFPDSSTIRRSVARHEMVLHRALPTCGRDVRRWLRQPSGQLAALWFLSGVGLMDTKRNPSAVHRVRRPNSRSATGSPRAHATRIEGYSPLTVHQDST